MAAVNTCRALVTGPNRGLGLEIVKQILEAPCSKIFAGCRDPDGPNSEVSIQRAAQEIPIIQEFVTDETLAVRIRVFETVFGILQFQGENAQPLTAHFTHDVADPCSIKESAKKVGSLLGKNGLNLLVNIAGVLPQKNMFSATVEDMKNTFNTNMIGPLFVIRKYLPYLRIAAKASGKPGLSSEKPAIINISTDAASMSMAHEIKAPFPLFPYSISKAGLNMLTVYTAMEVKSDEILCISLHPGWVKTDMGGEEASIDTRESVEGMLRVIVLN